MNRFPAKWSVLSLFMLAPGPPVWIALLLVALALPAQGQSVPNAYRQRLWREAAVARIPLARPLVEQHGDAACLALAACSEAVATQLAWYHQCGRLNATPRPKELLGAIAQGGGNPVAWYIMHHDLRDLDTCDGFLLAPADVALGIRSLDSQVAQLRASRIQAQTESGGWFSNRLIGWAGGVLLLWLGYRYWKRRRQGIPGAA